jgi:hypothetical protein
MCAVADALRLRFSPRSCLPRYVPCGRAWRYVSTSLPIRAKPSHVWNREALARLSWCGPVVTVRAASLFSGPPRCVASRIAAQAKRRVRTGPQRRAGRDRRWPQRGCGPTARAPRCSPVRPASVGCAGWTIAGIVFWSQSQHLCRLDKTSYWNRNARAGLPGPPRSPTIGGDFLRACERPRIGGVLNDRFVSQTADLRFGRRIGAFFSALEIPFPGNGDRRRRRLGSNGELARRKSKHLEVVSAE